MPEIIKSNRPSESGIAVAAKITADAGDPLIAYTSGKLSVDKSLTVTVRVIDAPLPLKLLSGATRFTR
jgi:hypothetical protein